MPPPPQAEFRYCPLCGDGLDWRSGGTGDDRSVHHDQPRQACPTCGWVHYRNPAVGVAVLIAREFQWLLGRRASGGWCVPCGYVEWNESVRTAARREMLEETGLDVEVGAVAAVESNFHDPSRHTVGIWFHGSVLGGTLRAGSDLQEVAFFSPDQLPPLAFPTDEVVLQRLRRDTEP